MVEFRRLPVLVALSSAVVLVAPAGAAPTAGDEPCGDTAPMASAGTQSVQPPGDRNPAFDIRGFALADIVEDEQPVGTSITLELCGEVPGPELPGTGWFVGWGLPDGCSGGVSVSDAGFEPPEAPKRVAVLSKSCSDAGRTPVLNGASSTTRVVYSVDLPATAWRVTGSTITWDLRRDAALGQGAQQVAAGTVLQGPSARTRDGRQVTLFDVAGVRVTGPGTEDTTARAADHRVG